MARVDRHRGLGAALTALLFIPAALLLLLVVVAVAGRLAFPLDLEWLEGSQIYHAYRLLHGQPLYRLETSGFLPHPYPPVQPLLVAAAGAAFGLDYLVARAVSVAAFVISTVVVALQVWRHWRQGAAGAVLVLVTAGYLAATYSMTEGWYDTARIDSVALVFVLLAAAPLAGDRLRWPGIFASAALAAGAIYTKQTTVFFVAAFCIVTLRRDWKKGLALTASVGALCLAALLILEHVTRGGFLVWLLNTRHHDLHPLYLLEGTWQMLSRAPFLLLLPFLCWRGRRQRRLSPRATLWLGALIAAVPAGLLPYAKQGGATNSLIPLWFLAGPVALILIGDLASTAGAASRRAIVASILVVQAVYLPFFLFDPGRALPGVEGRRQARSLNRVIASLEGGVVCPYYPFLPLRSGQRAPQASWLAHADAINARMPGVTTASYVSWLHAVQPRWLLLTDDAVMDAAQLRQKIGASYVFDRELDVPRWDGLWLTNPLPRRLYRRADSPALRPASRPAARAAPP